MKKIAFLGCGLLLTGLAFAGESSEDAIIKQQIDLYKTTAASVGGAKDLDTVKKTLEKYSQDKEEIFKKIKAVPKGQLKEFLKRFLKETADGQETLQDSLAKFHKGRGDGKKNPVVVMETSLGSVKIELLAEVAPITVKNFLAYVDSKFYDGTIFHRVIPSFMIQGGGMQPGLKEKDTKEPIENEAYTGLGNERGTLAMARTDEPNSATAQFFINVKNNKFLNRAGTMNGVGYAVFGKVIDGMDVVDKIRQVETQSVGNHGDVPVKDVLITSIRRVKK